MLHNIPFELQQLDQWVVATGALLPDGKRDKIPLNPRTGRKADVMDRSTWGSFAEAQKCGYPFIGFVLSKDDPYAIIDLDDPRDEADPELTLARTKRHAQILEAFQSYCELSQSGNGVHIIVRGAVPHGVRRDKVEIYSDGRYMICTGNVYKPLPIVEAQELLSGMFHQMNAAQPMVGLVQVDGIMSDDELYAMASGAANAEKFNSLWAGDWKAMGYESQSDADFALISMLCFYSKDNEQVRRIFRWSGLGQRDKAVRDNKYLDRALAKIRAKELPPIDFSALLMKREQLSLPLQSNDKGSTPSTNSPPITAPPGSDPSGGEVESATRAGEALTYPPGFIGDLASYIYSSAIRPVPEIALAAAIALTAGVASRTYNISGSGLNQYLVILARTGSGKEGAAKGIDAMVSAVRSKVPMVDQFIGPGAFASGQAVLRLLDRQQCFVSVLGEFGFTLQSLCDPRQNEAMRMLKRVLLDVYAKSGSTAILRPNVYSQAENNTKLVAAPNITILGEATPDSFYDGLDATAIAQGLIPRFSLFEYDGPRPPKNPNAFHPPSKELVESFAALLAVALAAEQNRAHCPVQVDAEAQAAFDAFDAEVDEEMRRAAHDVMLQLWNRAHLKALKLGALIAVGINPHSPCVTIDSARWAINVTRRDIEKLLKHFATGDIGQGDTRMEADLKRAVEELLSMSKEQKAGYQIPERIISAGAPVIPLGYLRRRLRSLAAFRNHKLGASSALAITLKNLCEAGELQLVPPVQGIQYFGVNTPLYVRGPNY